MANKLERKKKREKKRKKCLKFNFFFFLRTINNFKLKKYI